MRSTPAPLPLRSDPAVADFERVRPRLLAIAAGVLAGRSDAEDVVQDAWVRWQECDRDTIVNPTAFLVTTTSRLARNVAASARRRRESPVGRWPVEPSSGGEDPAVMPERREALERAIGLLLQRLSTAERAALVLRRAFGYSYGEIAELLDTSQDNARQLVSRAGRHVQQGRAGRVSRAEHARFVHAFTAAGGGDLTLLEALLVPG